MRLTRRKVTNILREHGYKLTPQRRMVMQTIASTHDHLTPAAIYQKMQQDYPDINIGLVTIYRTLGILANLNLICELRAAGHRPSYTIGARGHHHHLICSNCGEVVDFSGCDLDKVQQNLSRKTGFRIDSHSVEFTGLCQVCQQESSHKEENG